MVAVGWLTGAEVSADLASARASCTRDGHLTDHNATASSLLQQLDAEAQAAGRMPTALWEALDLLPAGEPLDWWPPDAERGVRVTRFAAEDGQFAVFLVPIERREDTHAYRLYQATREVMARMIAGAAHDLRSPLSSMTFNLGVLRRRWPQLSELDKLALLAEFAASCEWQLRAVDELVEVATQTDVSDVPLAPLLDRIGERLRPLYRLRKNRLVIDVPPDLAVRGAVMLLDHVFLNLLTNAVQSATEPVTTEVRLAPGPSSGRSVIIQVQDDGPGITSALRPHIFQPYVSTKQGGSGMGLCLAREAARQLGGDIDLADSARGACFVVRLLRSEPGVMHA